MGYIVEKVTATKLNSCSVESTRKKRVAAYCRVSTNSNEQQTSYQYQYDYYNKHIKSNKDWEYAGIYADKGTATKMDSRVELKRMIEDCRNKKIDIIMIKSVSRLCRNTLDFITIVDKLQSYGVDIWFDKENIKLKDQNSRFILNILSSIAEEESLSISNNVKWAIENNFKQGRVRVNTRNFMGFDKDYCGHLIWDIEDSYFVYKIFMLYLNGLSIQQICDRLNNEGVYPYKAKSWNAGTVYGIIHNEKYFGDSVLQKFYTKDFRTKSRMRNKGERNKYIVHNSHDGIMTKEMKEAVEIETNRRKSFSKYSNKYALSNIIKCSCGEVCIITSNAEEKLSCLCRKCRKHISIDKIINSYKNVIHNWEKQEREYDKNIIEKQNLYEVVKNLDKAIFMQKVSNMMYEKPMSIIGKLENKREVMWQDRAKLFANKVAKKRIVQSKKENITDKDMKEIIHRIYLNENSIKFVFKDGYICTIRTEY